MSSKNGFSLVELMVTVAIIGILASLSIPSFLFFFAKARQAEATTNLSVLYGAEYGFKAETETFFADFVNIGYEPSGLLRYTLGFATIGGATVLPPTFTMSQSGCYNTVGYCNTYPANCTNQLVQGAVAGLPPGSLTTPTTFVATAGANINSDPTTAQDMWSIDQNKNLVNFHPGFY